MAIMATYCTCHTYMPDNICKGVDPKAPTQRTTPTWANMQEAMLIKLLC